MPCNQHSPSTVNFFKIIGKWNLQDEKILLPIKFTQKYEKVLSNPVLLKVPDGAKWKVHWNKRDGRVWLEKGWKEFVEHYSLAHGHMLTFKYEVATSEFAVQIFDMSTLEIEYPIHRSTNDNDDDDDDGAKAPNLQNLHTDVKAEEEDLDDDDDDSSNQEVGQEDIGKKNPSFKVKLGQSYVTARCIAIPKKFARKYLKEGPVSLKVLGVARTWVAEFKFWKGPNFQKYKLQRGWFEFRRDNNLQVSDVCVFKLLSTTKFMFIVRISHR